MNRPSLVFSGSWTCQTPLTITPTPSLLDRRFYLSAGYDRLGSTRPVGDFLDQFPGHRLAEGREIMHLNHEAAHSARHVLAVIVRKPPWRLHVGKGPRHRMLIDDGQTVDYRARL